VNYIETNIEIKNKDKILLFLKNKYKDTERIGVISKTKNEDFGGLCELLCIDKSKVRNLIYTNLNVGDASLVHNDGDLHHTGLFIPLIEDTIKFNWWDISDSKTTEFSFYDSIMDIVHEPSNIRNLDEIIVNTPIITNVHSYHNVSNVSNVKAYGISIRINDDKPIEEISILDYRIIFV
jgi:hypothetical protein